MAIISLPVFNQKDNYVFIPACCYAGNQFDVRTYNYPPMFTAEEARVDMPVTITNVPRLNKDGSGKIEVTTGDAAVPCVGVFSETLKRGILVFTIQEINGKNIGLAYEKGEIRLTWPAKREYVYRMTRMLKNEEEWVDEPAEIPYKVLDFECANLAAFYRVFFENRRIMGMDDSYPEVIPFEKQFEIQKNKFNTLNWHESEFYTIGTSRSTHQVWQPGWVGGSMTGYALMKLGGELEWERQMKTLDFLFTNQTESGLFHGVIDNDGNILGDGFPGRGDRPGCENWHLIRKTSDVLYFLFKHYDLMKERGKEIPKRYIDGTRKTADRFVALWKEYGQFGQFLDVYSGKICVGGSTSAGIAPAALAKAYTFFGEEIYLQTAEESAEMFYREHLCKGYTTGGPGEILQGVDSESGAGLLESFVALYEVTGKEKWLQYAKECVHYMSSWIVSYNYKFPAFSEFSRHGMKTIGSVFANIQNKHSSPGICTLSGNSIFKVWKWTGDPLYLQLAKDVTLTIGQYMSLDDRPIYDRNMTIEERKSNNPEILEKHRLLTGFINERVNMSDWETDRCVGGVFNGSCWSETSNLLVLAEVVPAMRAEGLI